MYNTNVQINILTIVISYNKFKFLSYDNHIVMSIIYDRTLPVINILLTLKI